MLLAIHLAVLRPRRATRLDTLGDSDTRLRADLLTPSRLSSTLCETDIQPIYTVHNTNICPERIVGLIAHKARISIPVTCAHFAAQRYHQNVRNNARPALSHTAHDGQHLLPAIGSDDDDWSGRGHTAQQLTIPVRGDTIARSRLLHKVCFGFGNSLRWNIADAIPAGYTSGVGGR